MLAVTATATLPTWVQYVNALGPLATLVAAVIAGIIGWRTIQQRRTADRKAEWWRRTQWAVDHAVTEDDRRSTVGLEALAILAKSPLADPDDMGLYDAISQRLLDEVPEAGAYEVQDAGGV